MKLFKNKSPIFDTGDNLFNQNENEIQQKGFITSPANIKTHCKVDLRVAIIDETSKQQFQEYQDAFSVNSCDIGKKRLVTMTLTLDIVYLSPKNPIQCH